MKNNNRTTMNPVRTTNLTVDKTILANIFNKTGKTILEQNELEYLKEIIVSPCISCVYFILSSKSFKKKYVKEVRDRMRKELINP